MKRQKLNLYACCCLGACLSFSVLTSCGKQAEVNSLKVHTIGDSTMADYVENTTRTRGWGEMLQEFFSPEVCIVNYARGGRSSRSFCEEGRWDRVKENLSPGDYVFIQFAHNDEKEGGKDGLDGRGTAPWTTYKSYLEKYVDETRNLGANPVFITPIIRRYFTEEGIISSKGCHDLGVVPDDSTLNYVRVMKHVARQKQVPLLDLTALTKRFAETLGAEKTIKCIYVPTDGTHTQATGAACYAQLVAERLQDMQILSDYVRPDIPLVLNPTTLDFQAVYVGDEASLCFDLVGLKLEPQDGILTLKAPEGMLLSEELNGSRKPLLEYSYTDGKLWNHSFFLHFKPTHAGNISSAVTVNYGNVERQLPVNASCKDITRQTAFERTLSGRMLKGLRETKQGIMPEAGEWPAEIDEDANRYVEYVIPGGEKAFIVRKLSFVLSGPVDFRVAYARGKDFYPRTDIGEQQDIAQENTPMELPINVLVRPGERLHIRIFPWSKKAAKDLSFDVKNGRYEGIELE